jgi:hypothetical protein
VKLLIAAVFVAALAASAGAHVLDEYLQSSRVVIEASRVIVHLELTPGVEIAPQIIGLIDKDRDDVFSQAEQEWYASQVARDLKLSVDGRETSLKAISQVFPRMEDARNGVGVIRIDFESLPADLRKGSHRLVLENHHQSKLAAYSMNCVESSSIQVTAQKRNHNQSRYEIDYSESSAQTPNWAVAAGLEGVGLIVVGAALVRRRRARRANPD